ncbi:MULTISPECIES: AMP-binding protein [unclassified Kocuria]|uniref:AMP-binding protein n=1 Tax=unclassified Kocuria TaxID=2649579 RepID=UPI000F868720|nr:MULTISPECIES: AMP-binding protein [unclassified Kocuria]MDN5631314.1 AMP-binding protein [Kocuria sp.]RUP82288.1 phenylacetate--CoA ligase family protein [Kocuria sp. HSID17590]RUQ07898.1 phenylacetate--CoA ligase family protein [Kocuria sp. HSID17582]
MTSIREYVAHMPVHQRELLAAPARLLPPARRYGPVYESTRREILKARTTPWWARRTVNERLLQAMDTAHRAPYYMRDPRYRALADALRSRLMPRDALRQLPIMTRQDLSANYRDMLAVEESRVELSASSGTSGEPIFFLLDRDRGAREWAFVVDAWSSTGYRLGDWRVFFRGLDLPGGRPYFVMGSTGEIVIRIQTVTADSIHLYWRLIRSRGIRFLHGYPSILAYLARLLDDAEFDTSWREEIRGILPVSEQFTPAQEQILRRAFPNAEISVFYGLSEKTVLAHMDEDHVYHPYPTYGHVELVDPHGAPVDVGERGRIVTTTLDGRGMPLLRYDTGDSGLLVGHDDAGTSLFRDILARRGREGLVRADGELFSTTCFNVHGKEFECVYRFKLRQEVPGRATLVVQPAAGAGQEDLARFYHLMMNRAENQVKLDLEVVNELPTSASGKFTLLDQRIPNAPTTWA